MKEVLDGLPDPYPLELFGGISRKVVLDKEVLAKRVKHLQWRGIMINLGRLHINREVLLGWANLAFEDELGAMVEQVKVLSKFNFLMIVRSHAYPFKKKDTCTYN